MTNTNNTSISIHCSDPRHILPLTTDILTDGSKITINSFPTIAYFAYKKNNSRNGEIVLQKKWKSGNTIDGSDCIRYTKFNPNKELHGRDIYIVNYTPTDEFVDDTTTHLKIISESETFTKKNLRVKKIGKIDVMIFKIDEKFYSHHDLARIFGKCLSFQDEYMPNFTNYTRCGTIYKLFTYLYFGIPSCENNLVCESKKITNRAFQRKICGSFDLEEQVNDADLIAVKCHGSLDHVFVMIRNSPTR